MDLVDNLLLETLGIMGIRIGIRIGVRYGDEEWRNKVLEFQKFRVN
jgi:radical SAM superfamily enzyme YgiQ (UPF0313 family)